MKVGVDIDGVLFDFVGTLTKLFTAIPIDPAAWDIEVYLSKSDLEIFKQLMDSKFMNLLPTYPGVETKLIPYLNRHHTVYIVSSRNTRIHYATEQHLHNLDLQVQEFRWAKHNKMPMLEDLDAHIEDLPKHLDKLNPFFPVAIPVRSYNKTWITEHRDNKKRYPYDSIPELIDILELLRRQHD